MTCDQVRTIMNIEVTGSTLHGVPLAVLDASIRHVKNCMHCQEYLEKQFYDHYVTKMSSEDLQKLMKEAGMAYEKYRSEAGDNQSGGLDVPSPREIPRRYENS